MEEASDGSTGEVLPGCKVIPSAERKRTFWAEGWVSGLLNDEFNQLERNAEKRLDKIELTKRVSFDTV